MEIIIHNEFEGKINSIHNIYKSQIGKPILTNEYEIVYVNIRKEIYQTDIKSKMHSSEQIDKHDRGTEAGK